MTARLSSQREGKRNHQAERDLNLGEESMTARYVKRAEQR
jgi:hypothetical protein